jgi:hypothetical protein
MAELRLRDFRVVQKNTLRGFATFEFPSGLVVHDMPTHTKNGASWVSFPSLPQLVDGSQKIGDNGKPVYKRIIEWRDRDLSDRFSEAAIAVIKREKPGALE